MVNKNALRKLFQVFAVQGLVHRPVSEEFPDFILQGKNSLKSRFPPSIRDPTPRSHRYKREDRLLDWTHCPNIVYVAATRSKKHLSLIHQYNQEPFPFFRDLHRLKDLCDVVDNSQRSFANWAILGSRGAVREAARVRFTSDELTRHIKVQVVEECWELITLERIDSTASAVINIPDTWSQIGAGGKLTDRKVEFQTNTPAVLSSTTVEKSGNRYITFVISSRPICTATDKQ